MTLTEFDIIRCRNNLKKRGVETPTLNEIGLEFIRETRNQLLQQTDWRMTTDYPYSDQAAWASYRTQLRNLPATATPTLDEQGNLIVDWPQAPSEV